MLKGFYWKRNDMWQDYVLTFGGIGFAIILLPALRNKKTKMPLVSSAFTAFILYVFAATMASLGLYFTAASNLLTAGMWTAIAILRR